jgi:orotate phosphoribosyltransferase
MDNILATSFFELISGRRGHFRLESGYHSELWFDLDALLAVPKLMDPMVTQLAYLIRRHKVAGVCGPLLGGAFLAQLIAKKLEVDFCFTERVMPPNLDGLYQASYRLPSGLASHVHGRRIAIIDDVMSAGSALRGTYLELTSHGAETVVAGALMVLGDTGAAFFAEKQIAVEAVVREDYSLWHPAECPHCKAGTPLENVANDG